MILKIPFDLGNVDPKRRGASLAPDVIQKLLPEQIYKEVKVSADFETTQKNIESDATKILKNSFLISIGGDHSVTYGLIRAFAKTNFDKFVPASASPSPPARGKGLIYFDAHLDAEDNFAPPAHEDVIQAIVNKRLIKPENILMAGVRKTFPKEEAFIKKHKIKTIKAKDFKKEEILAFAQKHKDIYISIDVDVIDPKEAPGTGYPEKNGLTEQQLKETLLALKNSQKIRAIDLVELAPNFDTTEKTSNLAARLLSVFLFNRKI